MSIEQIADAVIIRCSYRSSHQRCSVKKGVLKNFAKFTRKHLCQRLFFNKVAGLDKTNRFGRWELNFKWSLIEKSFKQSYYLCFSFHLYKANLLNKTDIDFVFDLNMQRV